MQLIVIIKSSLIIKYKDISSVTKKWVDNTTAGTIPSEILHFDVKGININRNKAKVIGFCPIYLYITTDKTIATVQAIILFFPTINAFFLVSWMLKIAITAATVENCKSIAFAITKAIVADTDILKAKLYIYFKQLPPI